MSEPKRATQSKTIITNGLTLLGSLGVVFGVDLGLDEQTKGEIATGAVAVLSVANMVLRLVTNGPVKFG